MPTMLKNPPNAEILMQSMRSMGYTFESAVADIIDNSISANATNIEIEFPSDPSHIYVAIIDDGDGMTKSELIKAMKYGSTNVNDKRDEKDLGRFGLGLKSASLSQCRRLTVISKKNKEYNAFSWDLDTVTMTNDWSLLEYESTEIENLIGFNKLKTLESGTVVLWEDFDYIYKMSKGNVYHELSKKLDESEKNISLIFHRFMTKSRNKVKILLNGRELIPLDPFLESHKKTTEKKEDLISQEDKDGITRHIVIKPYILPYQKDLSENDIKKLGGQTRLNREQGFYIYRNDRLIIWGTWFKMAPKNELSKYARIKIDIPNTLDDIWSIDIKKQRAILPPVIENQLIKKVEDSLEVSKTKVNHKATVKDDNRNRLWHISKTREDKVLFKINRNSPIIENIKQQVSESAFANIEDLINYIEKTIPYQDMYIAVANNNVDSKISTEEKAILINKAKLFVEQLLMVSNNSTKEEIIENVLKIQPFSEYEFIKEALKGEKYNDISR